VRVVALHDRAVVTSTPRAGPRRMRRRAGNVILTSLVNAATPESNALLERRWSLHLDSGGSSSREIHNPECPPRARRMFLVSRRELIVTIAGGVVAASSNAAAQGGRTPRIGFLGNSTPALEANLIGPWRHGLREFGYVEGENVAVEYRWAEGRYERFAALISELLALKVDVIVTAGTPAAQAVRRATRTVPLVMIAVGDPVGTGLVTSLARPGGNATGLVSIAPDLEGKRLQLLREIVPNLANIALLTNPANPFHVASEQQLRTAAGALHVKAQSFGVRNESDFDAAFEAIMRQRPGAMIMLADRLFLHHRKRIADFALKHRLPAVYAYQELVEAGGLMSFGPSYPGMHRRAAYFVDRILKGANPAELPMEQPSQFELMINLKTAKALGVTIPPSLLLRADQVIE
jgi:putative tryptophan/tyrosine transport system substrate-binding protein